MIADYLVHTVAWGGIGFLIGFLVGTAARDAHSTNVRDDKEGGELLSVNEYRRKSRLAAVRQKIGFSPIIGLVVVLLGLLTVAQGLIQSAAVDRVVQCHAAYANAFADALEARSSSSGQAQDALDQMMNSFGAMVTGPRPTDPAEQAARSEQARKAITDYLAKRAEQKESQRANPYPAPPRSTCPKSN